MFIIRRKIAGDFKSGTTMHKNFRVFNATVDASSFIRITADNYEIGFTKEEWRSITAIIKSTMDIDT